jgi:hypothetical protein
MLSLTRHDPYSPHQIRQLAQWIPLTRCVSVAGVGDVPPYQAEGYTNLAYNLQRLTVPAAPCPIANPV